VHANCLDKGWIGIIESKVVVIQYRFPTAQPTTFQSPANFWEILSVFQRCLRKFWTPSPTTVEQGWRTYLLSRATVSYRWVSRLHNFLVILWNLLKTKKLFINRNKQQTKVIINNRLVSPECFAGRTKFFCGPHVRHLCNRESLLSGFSRQVFGSVAGVRGWQVPVKSQPFALGFGLRLECFLSSACWCFLLTNCMNWMDIQIRVNWRVHDGSCVSFSGKI